MVAVAAVAYKYNNNNKYRFPMEWMQLIELNSEFDFVFFLVMGKKICNKTKQLKCKTKQSRESYFWESVFFISFKFQDDVALLCDKINR